jgi:hypothetical protein
MIFNSKQLEELENIHDSTGAFEEEGDEEGGFDEVGEAAMDWRRGLIEEAAENIKRAKTRPVESHLTYPIGSMLFEREARRFARVQRSVPGYLKIVYLSGGDREFGTLDVTGYLRDHGAEKRVSELAEQLAMNDGDVAAELERLGITPLEEPEETEATAAEPAEGPATLPSPRPRPAAAAAADDSAEDGAVDAVEHVVPAARDRAAAPGKGKPAAVVAAKAPAARPAPVAAPTGKPTTSATQATAARATATATATRDTGKAPAAKVGPPPTATAKAPASHAPPKAAAAPARAPAKAAAAPGKAPSPTKDSSRDAAKDAGRAAKAGKAEGKINPIDDPNGYIKAHFHEMSNRELARLTGLSEHTIRRKLGEWGLKRKHL